MPKVPKVSFWRKHKKLITVVGVVVLILAAAGVGVFFRWQQMQNQTQGGGEGATVEGVPGFAEDSLPEEVKEAQNLANAGKTDESAKVVNDALSKTTNNDDKYELYLQQGVNAENSQKWDEAIAAYKNAEAAKKTSTAYIGLGRAYEAKGDKASALANYKSALPLLPTDNPMYEAEKQRLENKVKSLGG